MSIDLDQAYADRDYAIALDLETALGAPLPGGEGIVDRILQVIRGKDIKIAHLHQHWRGPAGLKERGVFVIRNSGEDGRGHSRVVGAVSSPLIRGSLRVEGTTDSKATRAVEFPDGSVYLLGECVDVDGERAAKRGMLKEQALAKLTPEEREVLGVK